MDLPPIPAGIPLPAPLVMSPIEDLVQTLSSLLRLTSFLVVHLYALSAWIVAFVTLTLPRVVYSVLSWGATFTLRLNFTKVAVTLFLGGSALSYVWKVRYLNRYTELKEPPLVKDEGFDLHPDLATDQNPSGFHNYLDEFLSGIKVFGYLEKPVFHELARHLQTRRLVAGDTLNLDSEKSSFYIVVDGSVEVYASTGSTTQARDAYDDEDDGGYQLLNNVESGGTLSSLFTILSLFTEDVKLRYEEDYPLRHPADFSSTSHSAPRNSHSHPRPRPHASSTERTPHAPTHKDLNPDVSLFDLDSPHHQKPHPPPLSFSTPPRQASPHRPSGQTIRPPPRSPSAASSSSSTAGREHSSESETEAGSPRPQSRFNQYRSTTSRPLDPIFSVPGTPHGEGRRSREESIEHPHGGGTIARATVDTTLAVIPAEAFRKLTKKFPNAAAHIVQVILTRLQRVTFLTAHKYLGLTREVIRTEKAINELACYPLPEAFWDSGGTHRLRQRFQADTRIDVEDSEASRRMEFFALDTPYSGPEIGESYWDENPKGETNPEGVKLKYRLPSRRPSGKNMNEFLNMTTSLSDEGVHPSPSKSSLGPAVAAAVEEIDLRDAVMECISKAIGLVQSSSTPGPSVDASPMFRPQDSNLQKAVFNSSFGSLSFLGLQGLEDDASMTGSSVASFSSMEVENEVEILYFPQGSTLVKEGEKNAGLYFVIEGFLDVQMPEAPEAKTLFKMSSKSTAAPKVPPQPPTSPPTTRPIPRRQGSSTRAPPSATRPTAPRYPSFTGKPDTPLPPLPTEAPPPNEKKSVPLFVVKAGGIAGYLASLSGFPSYVDISAKTDCYVGFLPTKALERIMDRKPIVLLTLAKRLISLLSPLVLHIDSALEWMHCPAGQVLYRQGDDSDSFYIVINGRLRSITEKEGGGVQIQGEYGAGESVGELECITASPRPSTLHAIRDTEIARMPKTLFNALSVRHPQITIQISRIIAARVRLQLDQRTTIPAAISGNGLSDMGRNNSNLKTVAIIPINRHVHVSEFATKLLHSLETVGAPTSYLNQATVMQVLGRHAFSRMGTLKLAGWLAETEQKYRIVLYVADTAVSAPWTQTCIRQADCVLLVADGGTEPGLGEYEKLLIGMKTTARKELVLLHSERNVPPGTTRPWLKNRPWVHAHHHVEMAGATPAVPRNNLADAAPVVALLHIARQVEIQIGKYKKNVPRPAPQHPPAMSDFARLARRLCGKSIGVVLGGGGARGIAHIGVLRALSEQGVPIDMVGGTSIGSFVGGLYAREGDLVSTYGRAKRFSGRMSTLWRILTDLTYPVVAYTTGHEFNRGIYKSFYDLHIEDMWLPFFCNTTNITHSRMEVHTSGFAWRYIRASMSLAGLLPPLCDEGDMLVDGGYVDNLPVSVMLSMGAASVFAVDVGSVDDTSPRNYGESVSGWWVLLQRWNPFTSQTAIPGITEIQSRLTYVSSVKMLEEAKATPGVLYMRMPVTQFGTMEFKRFPELLTIGFDTATKMLVDWKKEGKLPTGIDNDFGGEFGDDLKGGAKRRGQRGRRNSI